MDRRRLRDEAGVTLVELMVVLTLTGLVLALVSGGALGIMRASNTVDVRTENVDHARLAVAALSRDVRAAAVGPDGDAAFRVAGPFHAEFHARIGEVGVPSLISIEVDAESRVVEFLTPPSVEGSVVEYPEADRRQRYIASYLHNDRSAGSEEPILRYYRFDGTTPVELLPTTTDATGRPTLSELDRRAIRMVELDLRMARDREVRVGAQRVTTQVRVPNQRDAS
jgi:type II secretory pathway pseudopilin PulG